MIKSPRKARTAATATIAPSSSTRNIHRAILWALFFYGVITISIVSQIEKTRDAVRFSPSLLVGQEDVNRLRFSLPSNSHQEQHREPLSSAETKKLKDMEVQVARIHNISSVRSCRILEGGCKKGPIIYYNPLRRERRLCGQIVPAESTIVMDDTCHEPSRLFPVIPDRTGQGMPAVKTRFSRSPLLQEFPCDIPCLNAGSPSVVDERTVDAIDGNGDWSFEFSMEGPQYYSNLFIDKLAHRKNRFWSTTSFESEVPLPYFSWAEYNIQTPAVQYDDAIKGASFLARNCNAKNNRENLVSQLQNTNINGRTFRVDALSACLHNADPDLSWNMNNKKEIMSKYLFHLAFENQNVDDYITEKLWGPLEAGTVPIYFGSPNGKQHVPDRSVIFVADFETVHDLQEYLIDVANNKTLYESYHAWRTQPLPEHFHTKYDMTHTHSTCRTCRWAYARMYGLGWDPVQQSVQDLRVPRQVCLHPQEGWIMGPVQETWQVHGKKILPLEAGIVACNSSHNGLNNETITKSIDGTNIQRHVWDYDGVLDILLDSNNATTTTSSSDTEATLLLKPKLQGKPQFIRVGNDGREAHVATDDDENDRIHYRLQDEQTRYTLLIHGQDVTVDMIHDDGDGDENSYEMAITVKTLPIRIRIIVEDVDLFHAKANEFENFFGGMMIQDFFQPMEAFQQLS